LKQEDAKVTMRGHSGNVLQIQYHHIVDGLLGSISADKTVKVWDIENAKSTFSYDELDQTPNYFRWSPDGNRICVTENRGGMKIFDIRDQNSAVAIK
jgi:WD40 repeat protein